jgi:hypothetical protein
MYTHRSVIMKLLLNKQTCLSFQNGGQEDKTGPVWGLLPGWVDIREGCRRVNMVEILCIYI